MTPTRGQRAGWAFAAARLLEIRRSVTTFVCWICGDEIVATKGDAHRAGWKSRLRTVRRGLREQVHLCPDCTLGRGVADRSSANG